MISLRWIYFGAVLAGSLLCVAASAEVDEVTIGRELVLGTISQNPKQDFFGKQAIVDYVVPRLSSVGVSSGKVIMAKNVQQMQSLIKQGKVDWLSETCANSVIFGRNGSVEVLARRWKSGYDEYWPIIFSRHDSSTKTLDDLHGRSVAFERSASTTGYYLSAAAILNSESTLVQMGRPGESPRTPLVGYLFSGNERNTIAWVQKGLVAAGAISNVDWNNENIVPQQSKSQFRIIHEGYPVPRALELVRAGLDPDVRSALSDLLMHMHESPEGRSVLRVYDNTRRFDPLPLQDNGILGRVSADVQLVQKELE